MLTTAIDAVVGNAHPTIELSIINYPLSTIHSPETWNWQQAKTQEE